MRKHLSTLLKLSVTIVGLIYVLTQVPLQDIQTELTNVRWPWLFIVFLLMIGGLVLRAYRWFLLIRGLGVSIPLKRLVELYFVGNFFNTFLPSGFGGDVVRVLEAAQDIPATIAAGTVIVDRLTGLLMLFVMALLALPFRPDTFSPALTWQITAVCLLGLGGGFILLQGQLIYRLGGWLPGKLSVTDPNQPLAKLLQAVQGCGWRAIAQALLASTLFNLLLCSWWMASGIALGYTIHFVYYLLVVPILSILLLIPSISGLGVREVVAPLLFAAAGLTAAQATTLSLLTFILMRLSGLIGAPIYALSILRNHEKAKTQTAESS